MRARCFRRRARIKCGSERTSHVWMRMDGRATNATVSRFWTVGRIRAANNLRIHPYSGAGQTLSSFPGVAAVPRISRPSISRPSGLPTSEIFNLSCGHDWHTHTIACEHWLCEWKEDEGQNKFTVSQWYTYTTVRNQSIHQAKWPVTRLTKFWFRQITISGSICKLFWVPQATLEGFWCDFFEIWCDLNDISLILRWLWPVTDKLIDFGQYRCEINVSSVYVCLKDCNQPVNANCWSCVGEPSA